MPSVHRTVEDGSLSRRDLLKRAGVVGGALAITPWGTIRGRAPERPLAARPATPHDARVAVVGAGLAGLTAAYRLAQQGVHVRLYEARDRSAAAAGPRAASPMARPPSTAASSSTPGTCT